MATKTQDVIGNVTLTKERAEALHADVVSALAALVDARKAVVKAVAAVRKTDAWKVLGYESWVAYCKATLAGDDLKRLSRDDKKFLNAALAHFGLSVRDCAAVTGTSPATAARDAKEEVGEEVAKITGDESDAKKADETTDSKGRTQTRSAKRGKGQTSKKTTEQKTTTETGEPKGAPKGQPKRTPSALADEAVAVLLNAWPNLTAAKREEIYEIIACLPLNAE